MKGALINLKHLFFCSILNNHTMKRKTQEIQKNQILTMSINLNYSVNKSARTPIPLITT